MTFIKDKWEIRKEKLIFRLIIAANIIYFTFAAYGVYSLIGVGTEKPRDEVLSLIECKERLKDITAREAAYKGLYEELSGEVDRVFLGGE